MGDGSPRGRGGGGGKGILGWRGKDSRVFLLDPVNRNQESKRERSPQFSPDEQCIHLNADGRCDETLVSAEGEWERLVEVARTSVVLQVASCKLQVTQRHQVPVSSFLGRDYGDQTHAGCVNKGHSYLPTYN